MPKRAAAKPAAPKGTRKASATPKGRAEAEQPSDLPIEEEDEDISSVGTPTQDDAVSEIAAAVDEDDVAYNEDGDAHVVAAKTAEKPIVNYRVPDNKRITTNDMNIFTATALISIRAQQIGKNGNALIDTAPYKTNEEVATAELLAGRCPIIVRRCVGTRDKGDHIEKYWEHFRPSEMILPKSFMHMSNTLPTPK